MPYKNWRLCWVKGWGDNETSGMFPFEFETEDEAESYAEKLREVFQGQDVAFFPELVLVPKFHNE